MLHLTVIRHASGISHPDALGINNFERILGGGVMDEPTAVSNHSVTARREVGKENRLQFCGGLKLRGRQCHRLVAPNFPKRLAHLGVGLGNVVRREVR
jgi:hypothetical protein